jgi:hypothetical protein
MSLDMADSYRWLGAGHTGGGFDVIWRGLGSVHVPKDKQDHYNSHMDKLAWYYDLCRRPKGGFSILGNAETQSRYGGEVWGYGLALAYTAPRKTLRITGAPHTRYSQKVRVPDLPWGRPGDLEFLRTDCCEGFGKEEMEPHEIYDKLGDDYNKPKDDADKAFCVKMMRHYNPVARRMAGAALARLGASDEILAALQHQDPRVRRAALDAIDKYNGFFRSAQGAFTPAVVSAKFLPGIEKALKDPDVSMWELDGAILALSRAEPADIEKNLGLIRKYLVHDEWWLRQAAFAAIVALAKDEKLLAPELPALLARVAKETHVFPRRYLMGQLQLILKDKAISSGMKEQVVAGMLQGMRDTVIEPGYLGGIGRSNRYETLRYFLEQTPEAAPQVIDDLEKYISQPGFFPGWGWPGEEAWFTGDSRGNPGIIKCAEKLGKTKGTPILARCKSIVAQLEQQKKQSRGKDPKAAEDARDKMVAAVTKAIQECQKKMDGK